MTIYLFLLGLIGLPAALKINPHTSPCSPQASIKWISFALILIIGLRHEVGGDWDPYILYMDSLRDQPFTSILTTNEPGYLLLNWIGVNVWGGIYVVNILSAAIFVFGLNAFSRQQPRPNLAILISLPYLVVVVAMGYTRQSVAIGLVMLGMAALYKKQLLRYVLWVIAALFFHKTAAIMLPFAFFALRKHRILVGLLMALMFLLMAALLREHASYYLNSYVNSDYESKGATGRLLIIVIPAILFVISHRRFAIPQELKKYWLSMSWASFLLLILLTAFPENSTAIDRIALYWIPFEMMVLSHLPDVLAIRDVSKKFWLLMVVACSSQLLLIWLTFANHSMKWLPYQFFPWVWMWS